MREPWDALQDSKKKLMNILKKKAALPAKKTGQRKPAAVEEAEKQDSEDRLGNREEPTVCVRNYGR